MSSSDYDSEEISELKINAVLVSIKTEKVIIVWNGQEIPTYLSILLLPSL